MQAYLIAVKTIHDLDYIKSSCRDSDSHILGHVEIPPHYWTIVASNIEFHAKYLFMRIYMMPELAPKYLRWNNGDLEITCQRALTERELIRILKKTTIAS